MLELSSIALSGCEEILDREMNIQQQQLDSGNALKRLISLQ